MKSNFHTHSTYCDGKHTLEENVLSAIDKGFDVLGFSSHAELPHSNDWHIQLNKVEDYCKEIAALKEKYADKIKIRLGFEADFIPGITERFPEIYSQFNVDYLIGSVHYVYNGKGFFEADDSAEAIHKAVEEFYSGNAKAAVIRYFEQERDMMDSAMNNGKLAIIGHADLIRKSNKSSNEMNKGMDFFHESESWYKEQLVLTADKIAKCGAIAEINTGAIARNNMKTPYPSEYFLSLLKDRNVPITINSDSHDAEMLDCAFDMAKALAKKIGYRETVTDIEKSNVKFSSL